VHIRRTQPRMGLALAAVIWMIAGLVVADGARAASASITVTTSAGLSDPAAGVPRVFTVRGISDGPGRVYVSYRGPGGAACAPSASSDSGRSVGSFYGSSVNGAFNFSEARTWNPPGTVVFCIWIARSESAIAVPITETVTFRPPIGTISAMLSPLTPAVNEATSIIVQGQSEAPARVYARIRPGGACAPSFDADSGRTLLTGDPVNGSFSLQATMTQANPGAYAMCMWLALSSGDATPVAGPVLQRVHVLGPPRRPARQPPCLVPGVTRRIRLVTMKSRLRAANCTVGKVRYIPSRRVPRRVIVRLSSRAGSKLQTGSPVTIYVSTGRGAATAAAAKR